jgi:hypothetical protein
MASLSDQHLYQVISKGGASVEIADDGAGGGHRTGHQGPDRVPARLGSWLAPRDCVVL